MSYNQFIHVPDEVRRKLPFLGAPFYYLYRDSSDKVYRNILFQITYDNFKKAHKRLSGDTGDIMAGDKVLILPNCRIPMFKIKDYIKKTGATIVSEMHLCTKIIGHARTAETINHRQLMNSAFLANIHYPWYVDTWHNTAYHKPEVVENQFRETISSYIDRSDMSITPERTIVSKAVFGRDYFNTSDSICTITPSGAMLLYYHILNKIPVVSEDCLYEKIGKPVTLGPDEYETIKDMLASADDESRRVGAEMLANCDIIPSLYYIGKLARQFYTTVRDLSRFKNIRLFIDKVGWYDLYSMNNEEFIEHLHVKGALTKEYFAALIGKAAEIYRDKLESDLFSITLQPSPKYMEFGNVRFEFNRVIDEDKTVEIIDEEEEEE